MSKKDNLTPMQRKAVEHVKGNALVSASAGSGKTRVVIDRIIRLITEEGVKVNEILAVTFTKLAAEEMKDKLKNALTKKYLATRDRNYKEQLELVSSSDICTIDSFCSKLIRKYFYVLGIDANLQVLEESKQKRLSETAMEEVFERLYEENDEKFRKLIPKFDKYRGDNGLKDAVKIAYKYLDREEGKENLLKKSRDLYTNAFEYLTSEYKEQIIKIASEYKQEFLVLQNAFTEDEVRKEYCARLVTTLDNLLNCNDYFEFFSEYKNLNFNLPNKASKQEDLRAVLKDTVNEYKKKMENFVKVFGVSKEEESIRLASSLEIVEDLINLAQEYSNEYQRLKEEENAVDFADIERYASVLLKNEEILSEVKSLYSFIFVDEYQDVNDIQEQIIVALTNDNSFLVGDSKQSIYAFRGCNPEFFNQKYKSYNDGLGTPISLDYNFRSAKKVVDGVNEIFSAVMTESYGGTNYLKNPMIYGGLYGDYEGVCQIHLIKKPEKKVKEEVKRGIYSVANAVDFKEEEDVSSEVKFIVNLIGERLGKQYFDPNTKTMKTIGLGDICILLRAMGSNSKLGEELVHTLVSMGIPVSSSVKKSISDYPEIKVLTNLVSLLVCAERDIPLATIMLNMGGFCEDDLSIIASIGASSYSKSFSESVQKASEIDSELGKKCSNFLSWLSEKRLLAEFLPASEILNSIIKETGYLARVTSSPYGYVRVKRIERFLIEATASGKKLRVVEFEGHISEVLKDLSISESFGEETIKVMTMHASKGLEYPVVIVAGVAKQFNLMDLHSNVIYEKNSGLAVKSYNEENMTVSDNVARSVIVARGKKATAVEELRLFYVALTRAKCELYLTMTLDELSSKFSGGQVNRMSDFVTLGNTPVFFHDEEFELNFPKKEGTLVAGREVESQLTKKIIDNLSYEYPYKNEIALPVKSSVSDANKNQAEYFARTDKYGESSSEKGTAYHRLFELLDFYSCSVEKDLSNFIESGLISKEQADYIDVNVVNNLLKLPIFSEIKNHKLLKEQKFCHLVSASELLGVKEDRKVLVQGICDLIAIKDDKAILIDYKITTIEKDEDIVKAYKTQMDLYKGAIENVMKLKVEKVLIINVLQQRTIEV